MQVNKKIIVAVDGFSSCGKSTFAKAIARLLSYIYIDTGAMYRACTLYFMQNGAVPDGQLDIQKMRALLNSLDIRFDYDPKTGEQMVMLNNKPAEPYIRSVEVSDMVSKVSAQMEVRHKMIALQQDMGKNKGIVMDGRDIGTVVFPDAEIKIFMTAGVEVRAQRRYNEMKSKNIEVTFDEVKNNIEMRDQLDLTREISPLVQARDALVLDNSHMTVQQQMEWVSRLLEKNGVIERT